MRARIILTVVLVLAGALSLAGAVSYTLVRHAASDSARTTALSEDETVARHPKEATQSVLALIGRTASVSFSIVEVRSDGTVLSVRPPLVVPEGRIDGRKLAGGGELSGVTGGMAYALVPLLRISGRELGTAKGVVVALGLERPVTSAFDSVYYFLLGGGIALFMAAAVMWVAADRISRGVRAASAAAGRIAAGHLDARVERAIHPYPELTGLEHAIDTMAENLARARDQERQFLLSISHDLRTPLTSIRGYAEAIKEGLVPDPARAAQVVLSEATRLERLIRDLLDLAKLEARQFSLHAVPCDLVETVETVADALRLAHESAGIELSLRLPAAPIPAVADAERLAQLLGNLVENALKYAATRVEVHLEEVAGRSVLLTVEDDGAGIDAADMPHVFERFFTAGRHLARGPGSGLGLAIVAELAEAMGGRVAARSPLGEEGGTRVQVVLPLLRPAVPAATSPVLPAAAGAAGGGSAPTPPAGAPLGGAGTGADAGATAGATTEGPAGPPAGGAARGDGGRGDGGRQVSARAGGAPR